MSASGPHLCVRIGEPALANEFSRVVADLAEFLMPAAKAAATSIGYPVTGNRWVRGSTDDRQRSRNDDFERIPVLTPQGHLVLAPTDERVRCRAICKSAFEAGFERGAGHGLLELGIREVGTALLRILRTGENSQAATSRCYVRLRNQTAAQIPHR